MLTVASPNATAAPAATQVKTKNTDKPAASIKTTKAPSVRKIMVPPPPPVIPLIGGSMSTERGLMNFPVPLEYLTRADLERLKTQLESSSSKLKQQLAERNKSFKEKEDRMHKFESLYQMGVVSLRELEATKKEFEEIKSSDTDIDERVKEIDLDLTRITNKLKTLDKNTNVATSLKKMQKNEKHTSAQPTSVAAQDLPAAKSVAPSTKKSN